MYRVINSLMISIVVIPAKAGIQDVETRLDSGSRPLRGLGRNDAANLRLATLVYRGLGECGKMLGFGMVTLDKETV